jgi:pyruvate/2-oxoglutarate/acetoin dehydrogenase E1 component
VRAGSDVTLVTYGATVLDLRWMPRRPWPSEGIEAEVIDLRGLQPWDEATVLASRWPARTARRRARGRAGLRRRRRDRRAHGRRIGFDELDAPLLRVGGAVHARALRLQSLEQAEWRRYAEAAADRLRPCAAP